MTPNPSKNTARKRKSTRIDKGIKIFEGTMNKGDNKKEVGLGSKKQEERTCQSTVTKARKPQQ